MNAHQETMLANQEVLEANEEGTGAIVEQYEGTCLVKVMHVLPVLQDQASNVLHGAPKELAFEKIW
jgi:hypothetical protein